jgi:hypothetical protein
MLLQRIRGNDNIKNMIGLFLNIFLAAALVNTIFFVCSENAYATQEQVWTDQEKNIKIQFLYEPEKPITDGETIMKFIVQDLKTGKPFEGFKALVAIIEIEGDQRILKFENTVVQHGIFVIRHVFRNEGDYQLILRIDKPSVFVRELASFNIYVFPATGNITSGIIYGIVFPSSALVNLLIVQKRRNQRRWTE